MSLSVEQSNTFKPREPVVPKLNTQNQSNIKNVYNKSSKCQVNTLKSKSGNSVDILIPLLKSTKGNVLFLVDTGAEVSLLKRSVISVNNHINYNEKMELYGINLDSTQTLGTVQECLQIGNSVISHTFHLVPDEFPIDEDGILGKDFILKSGAVINLKEGKFTVNNTVIKFQKSTNNQIIIPARSEKLIEVDTCSNVESICHSKMLKPGLYLGGGIIRPVNNKCIVSVLNVTEHNMGIDRIDLNLEPVENFQILNFNYVDPVHKRLEKLKGQVDLEHLNPEEFKIMNNIIRENNDLFFLEGDTLTYTNAVSHSIPTFQDKAPINVRPYRLPESSRGEINKQVGKMLDDGIIQHSKSAWNSPLLVVPKKCDAEGKKRWRVVVDFRKLNEISIGDAYPLPNITDILDQLGRSKYFTTMDLANGYHQVRVTEEDRVKTAFSTQMGHFEFLRMPFGLKTAPATFQRLMNTVLSGMQGLVCFVYMDDIVVYGNDINDHNTKLLRVFDCLRKNNLKLQPEKCHFLCREVVYLGHKITENGLQPDPNIVRSVRDFPVPKNAKDIKAFIGLTGYYRRFVQNYATIAKPLTKMLKDDVKFVWSALCDEAFHILKEQIINPPVLQFPDFSKEFILTTDASKIGIGAVLSQGVVGNDLPIAFGSRGLNQPETNYSTSEMEMLAIVWAVQNFRPYLYGRKFKIITDHKPLTYIFNVKDPSSRLMRWRIKLEEYDYEVYFKPGKQNSNADALSRYLPVEMEKPYFNCQVLVTTRAQAAMKNSLDSSYQEFCIFSNSNLLHNTNVKELDTYKKPSSISKNSTYVNLITHDEEAQLKTSILNDTQFNLLNTTQLLFLKTENQIYLRLKENITDIFSYELVYNSLQKLIKFCQQNDIHDISFSISSETFAPLKKEIVINILKFLSQNENLVINLYVNKRIILTKPEDIKQILNDYHKTPLGGHQGYHRTCKRIQQTYYWKNMFSDISNYIKHCESCQKNKYGKPNKIPMKITTTASIPFEKLSLDLVGPNPVTENGNRYLLTFQDDLSKFAGAVPIPNQETETISKAFTEYVILKHGIPKSILTDMGSNLLAELLKEVCKLLGIKKTHTTAYHPQSNGGLERSHRTLKEYLRNFINKNRDNWDEWAQYAIFTYNTTPHTATKFTPHEILYGFKAEIPNSLQKQPEVVYNYDNYAFDLKNKLQNSYQLAKDNLIISKEISKKYYDKNSKPSQYKIGDKVLLEQKNKPIGKGQKGKKYGALYHGPYEVTDIISNENTRIKVGNREQTVHNNRIKLFFD